MCNEKELTPTCPQVVGCPKPPSTLLPSALSLIHRVHAQLRELTGLPNGLQFGKDLCQEVHLGLLMAVSMGRGRGGCCHPLCLGMGIRRVTTYFSLGELTGSHGTGNGLPPRAQQDTAQLWGDIR